MREGVVLLDGAVGTSLWEKSDNREPVWRYNLENPAIVSELHAEMIDAGARIILANTFGANGPSVARSPYKAADVVSEGMRLAKAAVRGTGVRTALSAGPLSALMEPYGDLSEEETGGIYREMLAAGVAEGPDLIMLQTFIDLNMLRVALKTARGFGLPVFCSMSFEKVGRTMMGDRVEDVVKTLEAGGASAVGLNCSLEPSAALPVMAQFRQYTDLPLLFKPNAGKPTLVDGETHSGTDAETFARDTAPAVDCGVTYIGGCCGTNASYIAKLREELDRRG